MLSIFKDNWQALPTLNDGERLIRIITDNSCDELYAIVDEDMDVEEEIRRSLRHKFGNYVLYGGYTDMSYLYEMTDEANKEARRVWSGEGFYRIFWSDGGMDWTNNGPVWFDTADELAAEIMTAKESAEKDMHFACAERTGRFERYDLECLLGDFIDDFDIEGIIDEATDVDNNGNRYWIVDDEQLNVILEAHEK